MITLFHLHFTFCYKRKNYKKIEQAEQVALQTDGHHSDLYLQ